MIESAALSLEPDWLAADGVASPELAATWCRLVVRAGGQVVTRVEDLDARTTREGVFCSAYPLAEWIATHWWTLRSHVRSSAALEQRRVSGSIAPASSALAAHNLRSAGDGFFWPALFVVPEGHRTLLAWTADERPWEDRLRFVSSGRVWASSQRVQDGLAGFVGAVMDRLHDFGVTGTVLEEEWSAISGADRDEAQFCDTAAALGLDPYDVPEAVARRIESLDALMVPQLITELAAAADPGRLGEDLSWITHALKRLEHRAVPPANGLVEFHKAIVHNEDFTRPPWEAGWDQARSVRHLLGAADTDPVSLDGLIIRRHLASTDAALQALGSAASGGVQVVLGIRAGASAQRFIDARALWRGLRVTDRPYLLTTAATYEQRVERAFAAELLAPARGIAAVTSTSAGVVLLDEVERVARRFKVSPVVVSHQMENQLGVAVAG